MPWIVAVLAIGAAGWLGFDRFSLSNDVERMEDRLERQDDLLRAREGDLSEVRGDVEDLQVCQDAARLSDRTFTLMNKVFAAAARGDRAEGQPLARQLQEVADQADTQIIDCLGE